MPAGNDATFTGSVTNGDEVTWSTDFTSTSKRGLEVASAVSSPFTVSTAHPNPPHVAGQFVTAFNSAAPTGYSAARTAHSPTVTITCPAGIEVNDMTVDGTALTNNVAHAIGSTGLSVKET